MREVEGSGWNHRAQQRFVEECRMPMLPFHRQRPRVRLQGSVGYQPVGQGGSLRLVGVSPTPKLWTVTTRMLPASPAPAPAEALARTGRACLPSSKDCERHSCFRLPGPHRARGLGTVSQRTSCVEVWLRICSVRALAAL
jgi:hypothetical protein